MVDMPKPVSEQVVVVAGARRRGSTDGAAATGAGAGADG